MEVLMRMKVVLRAGSRSNSVRISVAILAVGVSAVLLAGSGALAATCTPVAHAPITIKSDGDFTAANGVVSGDGSAGNPYLISNVKLNDLTPGYGLKVDNSKGGVTKYFNIQCVQSTFQNAPPKGARLIWLVGVHTTTRISYVSANSGEDVASDGTQLDSSSNIKLDNLRINKFGHD